MDKKAILSTVICAIFASSIISTAVDAQTTISDLSVPEFTLRLVANPYDVLPTTTIDPFTGRNTTTSFGYHEENKSIEILVKNQPFTSTVDASGNRTSLYYGFRYKGHFSQEWISSEGAFEASNSDYTLISVNLHAYGISDEGEVDFQVRALIGHKDKLAYESIFLPPELRYYYKFVGQTGDWTGIQTIAISEALSPTPELPLSPTSELTPSPTASLSPSLSPSPTQPVTKEVFPIWGYAAFAALAFVIGVLVGVVVMMRRRLGQTS